MTSVIFTKPRPIEDYSKATSKHIETVAKARGYDSALSIATYEGSANPSWDAEARTFKAWRDAVWLYAHEQLSAVQSGQRSQPTLPGFIAELPVIQWP